MWVLFSITELRPHKKIGDRPRPCLKNGPDPNFVLVFIFKKNIKNPLNVQKLPSVQQKFKFRGDLDPAEIAN